MRPVSSRPSPPLTRSFSSSTTALLICSREPRRGEARTPAEFAACVVIAPDRASDRASTVATNTATATTSAAVVSPILERTLLILRVGKMLLLSKALRGGGCRPGRGAAAAGAGAVAFSAASASASASAGGGGGSSSTPTNLEGKVVMITGATAGIGEACAWRFAELKSKLILVGRREEKLKSVRDSILKQHPGLPIHCVTLDVGDVDKVMALPAALPAEFSQVSVLVNNAGLALGVAGADNNSMVDLETVMQTNVIGLIAMSRAFLPGMKARGEGHLIQMGSIAGHTPYATGSLYNASKFAVKGFTDAARHDLVGTPIRVTHISPGLVSDTEFSVVRMGGDASKAKAVYADIEALRPEDVADNVIYAATRPRHVQIADIVMFATNQSGPRDLARVGPSLGGKS